MNFNLCNVAGISETVPTAEVAPIRADEPPPYNMQTALDEIPIPEEFLDNITYEIMALPMVLPSGKTIDQITLEKHNHQEEKWGRAPTDPYSGQCFTSERKPVLNAALKMQIDKFLLQNSNLVQFSHVPRTIGTVTRTTKRAHELNSFYSPATESYGLYQDTKRMRTSTETLYNQSPSNTTTSNSTLEKAVQSALSNITRYTHKNDIAQTNSVGHCRQCNKTSNDSILYKIINCSHLICITCLTNINIRTCSCGKPFTNIDVERYHTSMLY